MRSLSLLVTVLVSVKINTNKRENIRTKEKERERTSALIMSFIGLLYPGVRYIAPDDSLTDTASLSEDVKVANYCILNTSPICTGKCAKTFQSDCTIEF